MDAPLYGAQIRIPLTPRARTRAVGRQDGRDVSRPSVARRSRSQSPAGRWVARGPSCGEVDAHCTSRQRNTHNTESREVRYAWHPWFGRIVTVFETLTKGEEPLSR